MKNELNNEQPEQLIRPILPRQSIESFHNKPQGPLGPLVNACTEEILVLDEFDEFQPTITTTEEEIVNDILKDLMGKDDEFLDSFISNVGEDFNIFNYVDPNNSDGKASILDNSNFGVEYDQVSPTSQQFHHQMQPQVEDATVMDIVDKILTEDANIGIQARTNQIKSVDGAQNLITSSAISINYIIQSTNSQAVSEETKDGEYYAEQNLQLNQEENDDVSGSNDKENFESCITQNECEIESIQRTDNSGIRKKCNDENSLFKTRHAFQTYKRIGKDEKLQSCKVCVERPHICGICDKSFREETHLRQHLNLHNVERRYKCGICDKSFRKKAGLSSHSKCHNAERPFACDICNKTFKHKSNLRDHLRIHKDERPHICGICDKSFRAKSHLRLHLDLHNDEKLYVCGICDKSFQQKTGLYSHSLLHKDVKPHLCKLCDKSFRRKDELVIHSYDHTGGKPFVCNVCQKAFTNRCTLKYHSYVHTGESPYKCNVCGKSFTRRANVLRHSQLHIDTKLPIHLDSKTTIDSFAC